VFLDAILARNPKLIDAAFRLHREAAIPPNTFVIDLDAVSENATLLRDAALKAGLTLYFTTKQIGFNPLVAARVSQSGIPKALAIDFREAAILSQNEVPIGHVGHIVQVPLQMIGAILELSPEVITVFSHAKAQQISQAAVRLDREVRLLLRVFSDKDFVFPGQAGGIALDRLVPEAEAILRLPNIRIAGVTSYPCLELVTASHTLKPSQNFYTILQAAQILRETLGVKIEQVNAPGNTCVSSMPLLAQTGATHAEPGHALTGTTYLHTQLHEAETPALVYVSEISHINGHKAYAFGGGIYRRTRTYWALVGSGPERMTRTPVDAIDPTAIDYYVALPLPDQYDVAVGDTVVLSSRAQIFVTRSYVAVVQGIHTGRPVLLGLFDAWGRAVEKVL
jgi:predicted amino acid racemase